MKTTTRLFFGICLFSVFSTAIANVDFCGTWKLTRDKAYDVRWDNSRGIEGFYTSIDNPSYFNVIRHSKRRYTIKQRDPVTDYVDKCVCTFKGSMSRCSGTHTDNRGNFNKRCSLRKINNACF